MKNANFFDEEYFGLTPVKEHKSNYSRFGGYREEFAQPIQYTAWIQSIAKGLSIESPTILDVGCAMGHSVLHMRSIGIEAYGIDVSQVILSRAPKDVRSFLSLGDILDIGNSQIVRILNEKNPDHNYKLFDIIASKDVLEHCTEDRLDEILLSINQFSHYQVHIVNTGQHEFEAFDGDVSHFIRQPLSWWREKAERLSLKATFEGIDHLDNFKAE